jgi:hypothetical protein
MPASRQRRAVSTTCRASALGAPDEDRRRRIAVKTVQLRRHVDVDDVAVGEAFVRAGDAVADDGVAARAHGRRESFEAELAGSTPAPPGVRAHHASISPVDTPGPIRAATAASVSAAAAPRTPHRRGLRGAEELERHHSTLRDEGTGDPIPF